MTNYYVTQGQSGRWNAKKEGATRASGNYETQKAAENAAKNFCHSSGGGEVRIQGRDYKFRDSDTIKPGNDPFPPNDKKHYLRIMETIKLKKQQWKIDTSQSLGEPGGFGEVFVGFDKNGEQVAIKRLKLDSSKAAERETYIGEELSKRSFKNIVPILDYGQDADSDRYFLIMPICSKNLWDEIKQRGEIPNDEIIKILLEILNGLEEVDGVVHRDLKPQNILFHDGAWKIADFGIAKFTEDSTSLETLRSSLTPPYAAPEQWNSQRPTDATDIYSLGCIAHALKTGFPPFKANDKESLREQHLTKTPPLLFGLPPTAQGLIAKMLQKEPEIRPSRERCLKILNAVKKNSDTPFDKFDKAVNCIAIKDA